MEPFRIIMCSAGYKDRAENSSVFFCPTGRTGEATRNDKPWGHTNYAYYPNVWIISLSEE